MAERPGCVLGVDGTKGAWVGVLLETGSSPQGLTALAKSVVSVAILGRAETEITHAD